MKRAPGEILVLFVLLTITASVAGKAVDGLRGVSIGEEGPAVRFGKEPEFSDSFYKSFAWKKCREAYLSSVGRLCERCAKKGLIVPADQVHHKVKITPENINDPAITLNHDNLEALCMDCHQAEHKKKRWRCDPDGHVRIL